MNNALARLFGRRAREVSEMETPVDGWVPPSLVLGRELTRLKLEQSRAVAEEDTERARRIHARRVELYDRYMALIREGR